MPSPTPFVGPQPGDRVLGADGKRYFVGHNGELIHADKELFAKEQPIKIIRRRRAIR